VILIYHKKKIHIIQLTDITKLMKKSMFFGVNSSLETFVKNNGLNPNHFKTHYHSHLD
jgi:hypothetical protein